MPFVELLIGPLDLVIEVWHIAGTRDERVWLVQPHYTSVPSLPANYRLTPDHLQLAEIDESTVRRHSQWVRQKSPRIL
jgi:hypothetical protein